MVVCGESFRFSDRREKIISVTGIIDMHDSVGWFLVVGTLNQFGSSLYLSDILTCGEWCIMFITLSCDLMCWV